MTSSPTFLDPPTRYAASPGWGLSDSQPRGCFSSFALLLLIVRGSQTVVQGVPTGTGLPSELGEVESGLGTRKHSLALAPELPRAARWPFPGLLRQLFSLRWEGMCQSRLVSPWV